MSTHEPDLGEQVLRIVTLRARSAGAPLTQLAPGANIVAGATAADVASLRSVFEAFTGSGAPAVDAVVEIDGQRSELDDTLAERLGSVGATPPVVDLSVGKALDQTSGGPAPQSQNATRVAQLRGARAKLHSELELVRREIHRAEEAIEAKRSGGGGVGEGSSDGPPHGAPDDPATHPADIAVMCDRLRELSRSGPGRELLELAESLEEAGARRIYSIHREEALNQLMAECTDAIESAERFLTADPAPPEGMAPAPPDLDEMLRAGARQARTIARLDLLVELSEFWRARRAELDDKDRQLSVLLAEANEILAGAGRPRVASASQASAVLWELADLGAAPAESAAVEELTANLRAFVGAGSEDLSGLELVQRAESRLSEGAATVESEPAVPTSELAGDEIDRLEQLRSTETRLSDELQVLGDALAALERGQEVIESSRSEPNPFAAEAGVPDAEAASRAVADRLRSLGSLPGMTLPVLLIDTDGGDAPGGPDPRSLLGAIGPGQVVWVTDRPEVLNAAAAMGEDVHLIGV